ncbi:lysocardiolipin acyltransferase 1-like isoform X2 [Gordionus sp. m RMFG-2023]|uniref:lysocardiolipin acyltransferase 1-like isoform X2 n=1 Tax=Gordionus sp. m RMFG-2023 TaxID=3053472 RepID=UPI0031FD41A8
MFLKRVKGIIFVISLLLTSFLGSIFFLLPFLFFLFINPILYRKIVDFVVYQWFLFVIAMVEVFLGIEVFLEVTPNINLNRVDWLFFWSCLYRINFLTTHKIILKSPLKMIPGAGWAMQMANFIFINRKWEKDQCILSQTVDYFSTMKYPCKILLFPEGTDFSLDNFTKSKEYAVKNGLQVYRNLLQPRTTGFVYLVNKMRQKSCLDTLLDVTVSYHSRYSKPQIKMPPCTESDILYGFYPECVKFSFKSYPSRQIPESSEALTSWCRALWATKDLTLNAEHETSYEDDSFNLNEGNKYFTPSSDRKNRDYKGLIILKKKSYSNYNYSWSFWIQPYLIIIGWSTFVIVISYGLGGILAEKLGYVGVYIWISYILWAYTILSCLIFTLLYYRVDRVFFDKSKIGEDTGLDSLAIDYTRYFFSTKEE